MAVVKQTKRYWYFVTGCDFGDNVVLKPRIPYSAPESEPQIKRICVAPTAAHCMSAIETYDDIVVYRTKRRVNATKSWDVADVDITKEHWLRRPTVFEKVCVVDARPLRDFQYYRGYELQNQLRERNCIIRRIKKVDPRLAMITKSDVKWVMNTSNPNSVI